MIVRRKKKGSENPNPPQEDIKKKKGQSERV